MVIYSSTQFLGPTLGPVIGGFIVHFTDWRWCFYVLLIWAGILLASVAFLVPESSAVILLEKKARRIRNRTGNAEWHAPTEVIPRSIGQTILQSSYRPFEMMLLEPMCLCLDVYVALILGILYLFFAAFPIIFKAHHGFNEWQSGLTFLGFGCGMVIAAASAPLWRRNYLRLIRNAAATGAESSRPEPEFRLPPAILGSFLIPISLFWFGWTQFASIPWIVPVIGSSFFGAGAFLIFNSVFTFLADAYPAYAASALAGNVFVRCCFAAAFPLFGSQMYSNLGYQWATSLLGFLNIAMLPFPYLFFRYGKRLRRKSHFASHM
ncbi:MAG: hypothetical protein M1821_000946 [Bathelium mastoideum]|nr:MAG: hypothetical protein M1821_000946 [Bathelium mastoideum]